MPTYDYICESCGFTINDVMLPVAERDHPTLLPCPQCGELGNIARCAAAPGVNYSINRGGLKTPETFKDVLRSIKKNHRRSTIDV